jgi:tetratricopeptide (TPR) repeat protein
MRPRLLHLTLVVTALSTGACVYYNGMYNANRLARSARKAEREGRTFEANGLWGQVATKAESVIVRHPTSKYAAEAEVLRGVALSRMGQCDQALGPLSDLELAKIAPDLKEDGLLALGRCQAASGNAEAADAAFVQLLDSKSPDRRLEARFQHARVLRLSGQYLEALQALPNVRDTRSDMERLLALAGAGRLPDAMVVADSLLARTDSTKQWDSLVVVLGEENPIAASSVVDRVRKLPGRTREAEAKMLLDDGLRLESVDTARAARRFKETIAVGKNANTTARAHLELLQMDLRGVGRPEELAPLAAKLKGLSERSEIVSKEISQLSTKVGYVQIAGNSVTPETLQGDLRLFLAAESARDSLAAPRLAETLFRRIPEQFPASAYAPKAILAAQQLNSAWADSARALLEERYFDSPYLAMIRGEATPEYRELEDSLGVFAAAQGARRPAEGVRRAPTIRDTERERPGRPRPTPGGSRVPEPQ